MTKQEKARLMESLVGLALATQTTPIAASLNLYIDELKDLPLEVIVGALRNLRRSWKFNSFPSLGVIREVAGCVDGGGSVESRAVVAWSKLRGKPGKAYDREGFINDPIARKVFNEMGGGYTTPDGFGRWPTDQEPWKRKEFIQLYLEAAKEVAAQPELTHHDGVGALMDGRRGATGNA